MRRTRSSQARFVPLVLVACAFGCNTAEQATLRIGVDDAPPFHKVLADGSVQGMAVDVFERAAAERNIRVVWVPVLGSDVQAAIQSGRVDAWAAVSPTPDRERVLHFTSPWIESNYYLVTERASGITRAQINASRREGDPRLRLAVAGFPRMKLTAARFFPGAEISHWATHAEALQNMCTGVADAALLDARSVDAMLLERPRGCGQVSIALEFLPQASNPVSIASSPRKAAVADSLQKGIMQVASEGGMQQAIDKWSGFSAAQMRSFFAMRELKGRSNLYRLGLAIVTVFVLVFAWALTRLRRERQKSRAAERAAANSEARFQAFMDHSPLLGFIKDDSGHILYMNRRFEEVFQRPVKDCLGKDDYALWPEDIAATLRRHDTTVLKSGESREFVEVVPGPCGEDKTWLSLKFPFRQEGHAYLGGMSIDITERERAKEALRISEERFRSLFAHATVGIAIADAAGQIIRVNNAFCRLLRLEEAACLRESVPSLLQDTSGTPCASLLEQAGSGITFETRHQRTGSELWTENCLFSVRDSGGKAVNLVVIVEDITQRKAAEAHLAFQAQHDLLTGLPNRRAHESFFESRIEEARDRRRRLCLLYIDLDDFKLVNDSMGHDAGDLVLREAAQRLSALVQDPQSLSRIGGDEFVLVQSVEDRDEAMALSARLRLAMEGPFALNGSSVTLRASVGFSVFPEDGADARTLRKKADDAMYLAKRNEKSLRFAHQQRTAQELRILSALQ